MSQRSDLTGPRPIPEISPEELKGRMERGDVILLLDVREQWEREIADLPAYGQVHMPLNDLVLRHGQLDQDAEIVVYCRSGARSDSAAQLLRHYGFVQVWNLAGGVLRWRRDVDPSMRAY